MFSKNKSYFHLVEKFSVSFVITLMFLPGASIHFMAQDNILRPCLAPGPHFGQTVD